jgi:hypothetical protein
VQTVSQLKSGTLNNCTRIGLSEQLTELPEELLNCAEHIEILDISNNQLSELPDWLPQLSKLKIIFASNNLFSQLPDVLGRCPSLEMIGFKANQIKSLPEASLPKTLRWLTLTDNQITTLPESIGQCSQLEKLLLAGNQLTKLPDSFSQLSNLQLLRISANLFDFFPEQVMSLPKLAWFAFAGNPFNQSEHSAHTIPQLASSSFKLGKELGRGASGIISQASWTEKHTQFPASIAVKKFKSGITSDGYPADELNAYLKVGQHPNIVESIAHVDEEDYLALIMRLIPANYSNLGLPPTFESCSRDVFEAGFSLRLEHAEKIIQQMTSIFEHLHASKVAHGDLYCHNTLIDQDANILFGDFGAASLYHMLSAPYQQTIKQIEHRALNIFISDVLSLCNEEDKTKSGYKQRLLKA